MAVTYEPIASVTLGSAVTTFSFTSIPATFTDLILIGNWKTSGAAGMEIRINNDSATNYSITYMSGNGSTTSTGRELNNTYINTNIYGPANNDVVGEISFMSYANTSMHKTVLLSGGSANQIVSRHVGLWRSTAAINSLSFSIYAGVTYSAGSTFSLYGIKAA